MALISDLTNPTDCSAISWRGGEKSAIPAKSNDLVSKVQQSASERWSFFFGSVSRPIFLSNTSFNWSGFSYLSSFPQGFKRNQRLKIFLKYQRFKNLSLHVKTSVFLVKLLSPSSPIPSFDCYHFRPSIGRKSYAVLQRKYVCILIPLSSILKQIYCVNCQALTSPAKAKKLNQIPSHYVSCKFYKILRADSIFCRPDFTHFFRSKVKVGLLNENATKSQEHVAAI